MEAMHGGIPNVAVALSIAGVVVSLLLGRFALPLWLLLVHVVGSPIFVSPLTWAIVGAAGIGLVLDRLAGPGQPWRASRSFVAGSAVVVLVAVMSASASPAEPGSKQQPIGADQRSAAIAMRSLPADARIAVVTSETWGNDLVGEWLPTLSGRTVVTTPQGAEWLGRPEFNERRAMHDAARACHRSTSHCLADALARGQLDATHVVIPRGSVGGPRAPSECCPALLETIRTDPRFDVVYDEAGALVAAWRP
jgi:hypothetical protein